MNPLLVPLLWILNTLVDSGGQLAFKAAAMEGGDRAGLAHWRHMAGRPWIWIGILCYIVEFVVWLAFLSVIPLAEGVLLGMISIVAVMVGGRLFFREHFTRLRLIGIGLIVTGVALVGLG